MQNILSNSFPVNTKYSITLPKLHKTIFNMHHQFISSHYIVEIIILSKSNELRTKFNNTR